MEYKLIPLQSTQTIPIHWEFTQGDYAKLVEGHRSNWCVFLRDDAVHICRIGGEEFYRFAVTKTGAGLYVADNLETYTARGGIYETLKSRGWTTEEIERHNVKFKELAVEEVTGLLSDYFDIEVNTKSE